MQNACGAESGEYFSTSLAYLTAWNLDVGLKHATTLDGYWCLSLLVGYVVQQPGVFETCYCYWLFVIFSVLI